MSEIDAMSTLANRQDGYGFVVYINSDDHTPPHVHVAEYATSPTLARIQLTKDLPTNVNDLQFVSGSLTTAQKKSFLRYAQSNPFPGVTEWDLAKQMWDRAHNTKLFKE